MFEGLLAILAHQVHAHPGRMKVKIASGFIEAMRASYGEKSSWPSCV